ncbi:hypothetical protein Rxyl_1281 [Rubrobacter xylanophilus DSM 9941]|uniref:Uncharacterized protein n=1 Tax=Rubrobacter xylanophilus (strain DSM 9941 / JCM 11954 / NBRC 16129 / PRD-1) TaxID=266117 RepID=Q1AWI3_RUBXD|nr:hypothetical protein [Rubrobacter xylanophilus]ABG04245.1 hypothetical protein Rxyl_1281 [Rubrobacter xylanophilus DSM 9941]
MHGIERIKDPQKPVGPGTGVRRVIVRYRDGRTLEFVPDGGNELFSEDDAAQLQKVFNRAASRAEWAEAASREGRG